MAAFVGRESQLDELRAAYARAERGDAQCILVEGPSGIGKTALVERMSREWTSAGVPVLAARCHERECLAYKAFDGVIDDLVHYLLELTDDELQRVLPNGCATVARLFPTMRRVLPGALPQASAADPEAALDSPALLHARALRELRAIFEALVEKRPVVLRIEDIQWADADSVELLGGLLEPPPPDGLLVVATLSSDDRPCGPDRIAGLLDHLCRRGLCHRIALPPLTLAEQRELVSRVAGDPRVLEHLDPQQWHESAGNPMLLVEVARHALEMPAHLVRDPALTVEAALHHRITRLPQPAQALLRALAVAGEPLPLRVLGDACGLDDSQRERASAILRISHLARVSLTERQLWLDVYHRKVRTTVVERLEPDARVELHVALARALESWERAPAALRARQWLAAGDSARAAVHLLDAARAATDKLAVQRAIHLYRQVITPVPRSPPDHELQCLQRRARTGLGALQTALAAIEPAPPPGYG